jgi:hypothetical protein
MIGSSAGWKNMLLADFYGRGNTIKKAMPNV